jgi:hypothetical protein
MRNCRTRQCQIDEITIQEGSSRCEKCGTLYIEPWPEGNYYPGMMIGDILLCKGGKAMPAGVFEVMEVHKNPENDSTTRLITLKPIKIVEELNLENRGNFLGSEIILRHLFIWGLVKVFNNKEKEEAIAECDSWIF